MSRISEESFGELPEEGDIPGNDIYEDEEEDSDGILTNITVGINENNGDADDEGSSDNSSDSDRSAAQEDETEQIAAASKIIAEELGLSDGDVEEHIRSTSNKIKEIENKYDKEINSKELVQTAIKNELQRYDDEASMALADFMASNILLYIMSKGEVRSIDEMIDERTALLSIFGLVQELESEKDADKRKEKASAFMEEFFDEKIVTDFDGFGINDVLAAFNSENDFMKGYVKHIDDAYDRLFGTKPFEAIKDASIKPIKLDTLYRL